MGELVAGRYRLIARLGAGGMGVVYRAYDERLHRTVAVKQLLLPAELAGDEAAEAKRRAIGEGRIAAKLQHPNLITVFDVTEHGDQPYLVMEYLPSRSLSAVLAERGRLSVQAVANIGAQAAAALASAHTSGVVHRDVKPGNVLLGDDGTVKITDFGISRAVEDATGTLTGMITGTPAYLAPEVARGQRANFASDVFSLGATLYTAVEGSTPFGTADNAMALLYRVAQGQFAPPTQAGPLAEVLLRLLQPDPQQRPTMAQAGAMLAEFATDGSWIGGQTTSIVPGPAMVEHQPPQNSHPVRHTLAATPVPAGTAGPGNPPNKGQIRTASPPGTVRRNVLLVAAAVTVLIVVGVLLKTVLDDLGRGSANPGGNGTTTVATTTATTTATSAPSSGTDQQQGGPGQGGPGGTAPDTEQAREKAITDYYSLVPANLQDGWSRLTPSYQRAPAGGYASYQRFWNQMSGVRAYDVQSKSQGHGNGAYVVEATVEYTFKTGRVVEERHTYTLVAGGDRWLIDKSSVLKSTTKRQS